MQACKHALKPKCTTLGGEIIQDCENIKFACYTAEISCTNQTQLMALNAKATSTGSSDLRRRLQADAIAAAKFY